jgi:hypothetical protein
MSRKTAPPGAMRDLIAGYWVSRLIYVAAKLGLADLLKNGARTPDDLAAATGVKAWALHRVLRTLASYGVFEEIRGKRFMPPVIERAAGDRHVTARGVAERCRLEPGNFFESVPAGGDAYVMKYILHNWDDESCVRILTNCRAAMSENGRVLVADPVISPGNRREWGKLLDIQMMVVVSGRERTREEFAALFKRAGLKLTRIIPTTCPLSLVEAVRA